VILISLKIWLIDLEDQVSKRVNTKTNPIFVAVQKIGLKTGKIQLPPHAEILKETFSNIPVEHAQKMLKKKYGLDISVADIQAALWFHEKELFSKLGVAQEKAKPADYTRCGASHNEPDQ
jgi:hypothetical protein